MTWFCDLWMSLILCDCCLKFFCYNLYFKDTSNLVANKIIVKWDQYFLCVLNSAGETTDSRTEKQTSPVLLVYRSLTVQDPCSAWSSSSQRNTKHTWCQYLASDSVCAFLERGFLWSASSGFPVSLHVSILVAAFSLLEYTPHCMKKCLFLVCLFGLMLSVHLVVGLILFFPSSFHNSIILHFLWGCECS